MTRRKHSNHLMKMKKNLALLFCVLAALHMSGQVTADERVERIEAERMPLHGENGRRADVQT